MTDRDAAVTGEREEALRLAQMFKDEHGMAALALADEVQSIAHFFLAEAARADALEAENERLRNGLIRMHLDSMHHHEIAMSDPFGAEAWIHDRIGELLSATKPTEGGGDA